MKKPVRSTLGTFILTFIADPFGVFQNAYALVVKRTALARQRMKSAPQAGITTLETIMWIGGIAVIAVAVIAVVRSIVDGWVAKIPK